MRLYSAACEHQVLRDLVTSDRLNIDLLRPDHFALHYAYAAFVFIRDSPTTPIWEDVVTVSAGELGRSHEPVARDVAFTTLDEYRRLRILFAIARNVQVRLSMEEPSTADHIHALLTTALNDAAPAAIGR